MVDYGVVSRMLSSVVSLIGGSTTGVLMSPGYVRCQPQCRRLPTPTYATTSSCTKVSNTTPREHRSFISQLTLLRATTLTPRVTANAMENDMTTYAAPSYYTEASSCYTEAPAYYSTKTVEYYTEAAKYFSAPMYTTTTEAGKYYEVLTYYTEAALLYYVELPYA